MVVFRIDRMDIPKLMMETRKPAPERFNVRDYTERIFNMYDEGEMETVTLRCRHNMIDHIIDYFGKDVEPFNITETTFDVNIKVCASATFFSWVMGYAGEMTITGPAEVCNIYRQRLEQELKIQYHPEYHGSCYNGLTEPGKEEQSDDRGRKFL